MTPDTHDLSSGTFHTDDSTLEEIFRLPARCGTVREALPEGLRLACSLPDWRTGRYRMLPEDDGVEPWSWRESPDYDALLRLPDERPEPGSPTEPALVSLIRPVPLAIELLKPRGSTVLHRLAYGAGLRTVAHLVIRAENRPVAELQLFGEDRIDCRSVRLLLSRLELVATRERNRTAIQKAAEFVRSRLAEARPPAVGLTSDPMPLRDPRTGLPRTALLHDRLRMAMRRRQRGDTGVLAVLHVDPGLDDEEADVGCAAIARRLVAAVRDADTVAHVADAEFVVIAEALRDLEAARQLGARLATIGRTPVAAEDADRILPCRVGLVVASAAHEDPADLLRDAALTVRRAPVDGGVRVFDPLARVEEDDRELLEAELRRALKSRELFLEYQPIVSLDDGRIAGLEAFIRWEHPRVGRIPPADFIDVAAVSPLIHDLGDWVVDHVCRQIRRWYAEVPRNRIPPVDVNFSQVQLLHETFVDRIVAMLRSHELPGECLRIDVSETDLMDAPDVLADSLARLREQGVHAVVDDFGTGFSSLQVLHTLPVTALKIDGAFIPAPTSGIDAWVIARTIIELGKVLDLGVIAEAVETKDQLRILRQVGCRYGQGYAFAGPVGPGRSLELIRDGYPLELDAPPR
jgi:EAL domain-containing protein (putative c-di-GMP-specific phosphodiesterase class I)/GGDEF domain-containing protein